MTFQEDFPPLKQLYAPEFLLLFPHFTCQSVLLNSMTSIKHNKNANNKK